MIAKELKIDDVRAELEPKSKQEIVKQFKSQGTIVMMAGDGCGDDYWDLFIRRYFCKKYFMDG